MSRKLSWDDLPSGVSLLFKVWANGADLQWGRGMWSILEERGLTVFGTEVEKVRVLGRLLALATLYHSFCQAAWDEGGAEPDVWAADLDIDPFRLGQLLGKDFNAQDELKAGDLLGEAAHEIVRREYPAVLGTLVEALGDKPLLFASLWLSPDPKLSGSREFPTDVLDEVLNEEVLEKGPGFAWVMDGSPIILV